MLNDVFSCCLKGCRMNCDVNLMRLNYCLAARDSCRTCHCDSWSQRAFLSLKMIPWRLDVVEKFWSIIPRWVMYLLIVAPQLCNKHTCPVVITVKCVSTCTEQLIVPISVYIHVLCLSRMEIHVCLYVYHIGSCRHGTIIIYTGNFLQYPRQIVD